MIRILLEHFESLAVFLCCEIPQIRKRVEPDLSSLVAVFCAGDYI